MASYLQRSLSAQVNGGPDATTDRWKQPFSAVRASGGCPGNDMILFQRLWPIWNGLLSQWSRTHANRMSQIPMGSGWGLLFSCAWVHCENNKSWQIGLNCDCNMTLLTINSSEWTAIFCSCKGFGCYGPVSCRSALAMLVLWKFSETCNAIKISCLLFLLFQGSHHLVSVTTANSWMITHSTRLFPISTHHLEDPPIHKRA